jgi:hypothetical protein
VVRGRDAVGCGANCLNLQGHGSLRRTTRFVGWDRVVERRPGETEQVG